MKAIILDTKTGEKFQHHRELDVFEWAENNWSCDCNRWKHPEDEPVNCEAKRFLIVSAIFGPDERPCAMKELNSDYPEDLLREHGILVNDK